MAKLSPAKYFAQIQKRMKQEIRAAEKRTLNDGLALSRALSSGSFSLAQLAAMDHPYATRHAAPTLPPQIINQQSGSFKRSWYTQLGNWNGDSMISKIANTDPVGVYLDQGTQKMVQRPIRKEIEKQIAPIRKKRLKHALRRALEN